MASLSAVRKQSAISAKPASLDDLAQAFLKDQDIKASSKATYERSLSSAGSSDGQTLGYQNHVRLLSQLEQSGGSSREADQLLDRRRQI